MSSNQQKFVWFELQAADVDEAANFYTSVVPWGTSEWEQQGDAPYTMLTAGQKMAGGVMELPEEVKAQGAPPMWLGYVGTENLEDGLKQLKALGGSQESDIIDIGEAGRFSVVSDPTGAVFALHQSAPGGEEMDDDGMPEQNEPGACSWVELRTDDIDAAWEFYSEMFGWEAGERMMMGEDSPYQLFGWEGRDRGGIGGMPDADAPPNWLYYFTVEDLDAACERVEAEGGQLLHGPMEVPGGDRIAHCRDPQGAFFALQVPPGK